MADNKNVERELKAVLKTIESAQIAVASELAKRGNLPYAYNELEQAKHELKRVLRAIAEKSELLGQL